MQMLQNITSDIWEYLIKAEKPIVLYGMGNGADKILKQFEKRNIKINGVFASDCFVRDKVFHGFKIKSYSAIKEELGNMIVIVSFGSQLPDVVENIKRIASEQELYAVDVPVFGDIIFDMEYYKNHSAEFFELYNNLADEQSKLVLQNIIAFKLTGKIEYLINCETEEQETENFLNLNNSLVFFDLGAYRGDTVKKFIDSVNDYRQIVAVEPDKKTFKKLLKNTEDLKNFTAVNSCVGEKVQEVSFLMAGGRNSHIGEGDLIKMETIDNLAKIIPPDFIKMDIEGNELSALLGGENTIKNNKPKMQIACYHRSEDLLTIYKKVKEINKDYKVYLRHFKYIPAWDINYYFV